MVYVSRYDSSPYRECILSLVSTTLYIWTLRQLGRINGWKKMKVLQSIGFGFDPHSTPRFRDLTNKFTKQNSIAEFDHKFRLVFRK